MAELKFTEASGLIGAAAKPPRPSLLSMVGGIKANGASVENGGDNSKLRRLVWGWSSQRSQRRKRLNIVLEWLLGVAVLALVGISGVVYYKKVYVPRLRAKELAKLIQEHAAEARERVKKCKGTTWQTACDALGAAGARRRLFTDGNFETPKVVEDLLFLDDPTITYNEFCLVNYCMNLGGNITFPYHASSHLADGGNYTLALLIQHGAMPEQYFCSFKQLMQEQGYRDFRNVLIIAPNFNYETDINVHPNDVFWNASKPWGDWRVGAESDPSCCGN